MIIFGTKAIYTKIKPIDVLSGACPECKGDLYLEKLRKWFDLYFIPIFPYETIDTVYKCAECKNTYKQAIKEMLSKSKEAGKIAKKTFSEALASALSYLSKNDTGMDKAAKEILNDIAKSMPEHKESIAKAMTAKDEDKVLERLTEARNSLSDQGLALFAVQIAKVIKAGKNGTKKEDLVKKYLLALGITKDQFNKVIEAVAKEKQD